MNRKLGAIILGLMFFCSGCTNQSSADTESTATSNRTSAPTASACIVPTITATPMPTPITTATPTPTPSQPPATVPPNFEITGFPIIYQKPELPTGCEITALTMMLQFYGYDVDKMTMAEQYLPTLPLGTWQGEDGVTYGPDLYNYFVGDPKLATGTICGAGALVTAANAYLADTASRLQAKDMTGTPVSELYAYVSQGTPVFVCATGSMKDRRDYRQTWYTEDGRFMGWAPKDHGVVLIGYTEDTVTIADPIAGLSTYDRAQFEKVYVQRGSQAVILQDVEGDVV